MASKHDRRNAVAPGGRGGEIAGASPRSDPPRDRAWACAEVREASAKRARETGQARNIVIRLFTFDERT